MFEVHRLNKHGMIKAEGIQEIFEQAMADLEGICGADGREMAIVRTKLQEASFFAKRAMAINPAHREGGA